jgi:hypothetical protein
VAVNDIIEEHCLNFPGLWDAWKDHPRPDTLKRLWPTLLAGLKDVDEESFHDHFGQGDRNLVASDYISSEPLTQNAEVLPPNLVYEDLEHRQYLQGHQATIPAHVNYLLYELEVMVPTRHEGVMDYYDSEEHESVDSAHADEL